MLGLQETRPPGTTPTKTYSCVACSATFSGLASLLVHQASHASDVSGTPMATAPTCSHCGTAFVSDKLLEEHSCMALPPPDSRDVCKSEGGEEFQESGANQEQEQEMLQEMEMLADSKEENSDMDIKTTEECSRSDPAEVPLAKNSPCPSPAPTEDSLPRSTHTISEDDRNDCLSLPDTPPEGEEDELEPLSLSCPSTPPEAQDQSLENDAESDKSEDANICIIDSDESSNESQKLTAGSKTLLKIVASAYVRHRQPDQITWGQKMRAQPPRKVSPRAPFQAPIAMATSNSEWDASPSTHVAPNREDFTPSRSQPTVKPSKTFSKKYLISTTKTLCPVVALETHQKLIKDNVEGRHQCGICRRVFQEKDSLIMHHVLHRKERVKFCRRCQQFVISITSVPDNHVCLGSLAKKATFFPVLLQPKKLFHCLMCNRSYTRRYRLRTHNCQGIGAAINNNNNNIYPAKGESNARDPLLSINQRHSDVGVNTEVPIKSEQNAESTLDVEYRAGFVTQLSRPILKSDGLPNLIENGDEAVKKEKTPEATPVLARDRSEINESLEGGQWTIPLDDTEVDLLSDEDSCDAVDESSKENPDEEVVCIDPPVNSIMNAIPSHRDYRVHVSEVGVKRFTCNRCQRSYSRRFTLIQHLKLCRTVKFVEANSSGKMVPAVLALKKKFPCPNCGVLFTRKDNMNMHRKRCQLLRRPNTAEGYTMLQKQNHATSDNVFVLPPGSKSQIGPESSNNDAGGAATGGSWGIMSLPSVLPRKVTCECGAAFTCPRLLFEHLQMHAMETYICSICGENLRSWAAFEAHQRLHVQPSQQNAETKGSQQQQQQQQAQAQPQIQQSPHFQSAEQNLKKEPQNPGVPHFNHRSLLGTYVCHRCKKVFRQRKYLLKHLRVSCKGEVAVQHKHSCSRCSMVFQSSVALDVHMRANACIPAFKPLRCPVCVSWFSSLEGLKRHLMSHSQKEALSCQICGCKCTSHSALEEHKKSVHGVNKPTELTAVKSPQLSPCSSLEVFRCHICQRSYAKLQSLKDHLRKVHRPKGLLVNAGMFEPRFAQQSLSKQFQCQVCARIYPDIQSLKNHRRRVHRALGGGFQPSRGTLQQSHFSQFQCQICTRSYPDITSLRNHRRRVHHILGGLGFGAEIHKGIVHQSQDSPYKCQICQRSYRNLICLKDHKRKVHRLLRDTLESPKEDTTDTDQSPSAVLPLTDPSETVSQD